MVAATVEPITDQLAIWRAAIELLDRFDFLLPVEPFEGECPRCHLPVCVVVLDGRDTVLDLMEVLPAMRCPRCASNVAQGNSTAACWRCSGSRVVGESWPAAGVALSPDGSARVWAGGMVAEGEGLLRPHLCALP